MAREALRQLNFDIVLFVPVGEPSHRDSGHVTSADHRCAMVAAAITDEPRFAMSTVDVERRTRTHTIDTLRDLRYAYGAGPDFFFMLGADNLAQVPHWHRGSELMAFGYFVGSSRRGYPLADPGFPPGRLSLLHIPHRDISSSKIRDLVSRGQPIKRLTPRAVERYIRENGLYRG